MFPFSGGKHCSGISGKHYSGIGGKHCTGILNIIVSGFTAPEIASYTVIKTIQDNTHIIQTFIAPFWTLEYCLSLTTELRKPFFKSVLLALKEQRISAGVKNFKKLDEKISQLDTEFNNWQDSKEIIAFTIYHDWIIGKKISKAIIAQQFSEIIKGLDKSLFLNETEPIGYLIKAIKHVTEV